MKAMIIMIVFIAVLINDTARAQKAYLDRYYYETQFYDYARLTVITPIKYDGLNLTIILTNKKGDLIKELYNKKIFNYNYNLEIYINFNELNLQTGIYRIIVMWGDSFKIKKKFMLIRN
ncbi:MAG: hypothetical protein N2490_01765 [Ignavibacteria bacterium]|nr:hypothetical protein [Ignavibacteria bacterium]